MNLGTAVACLSSSRNIYSINHETSSQLNKRRSFVTKSATKRPKLEAIKEGQQHVLYSNSSQDCPCNHHRLARLRDESQGNYEDLITASFEASLAPLRGLLTPSTSTGDSGVNTNSNGSRRSSGRGARELSELSELSTSSRDSSTSDVVLNDAVVTTTVIVENDRDPNDRNDLYQNDRCDSDCEEHEGCDDPRKEFWLRNNRIITQQKRDLIQISPENDPSQNWTLIKPLPIQEDCEDEADSLFSSIKTSHSSSLKALCTCPKSAATIDDTDEIEAPSLLRRVASFPRCHPNLDPHRYSLNFLDNQSPKILNFINCNPSSLNSLRQLPTVPPQYFWPRRPHSSSSHRALTHYNSTRDFVKKQPSLISLHKLKHRNASFPVFNGLIEAAAETASHHEIPPCVRNVIMHQIKSPRPPANPKMMKKLSKTITLPEDPYDPTAFTLTGFDHYDQHSLMRRQQIKKANSRKSRQVVKIVGSFSLLMTIGIVITVLCFLYWSDTFKPMTMM